jgi:hypothetical protein
MSQPNSLVKLAAIASSVLLLSGFVGYRAGAFQWLTAVGEIVPEEKAEPAPTTMYGSKAGIFVDASSIDTTDSQLSTVLQESSATGGQAIILPGSKSAIIVPANPSPSAQPAAPEQTSPAHSSPPSE